MNHLVEQVQRSGVVVDGNGNERPPFPMSMSAEEGREIYEVLRDIDA
ncbi:unnamed protein product [marine sediment metagenome]|uniref:Uncharacterized protein n=1 Tax=marine sediment metagenome TaxID=412755 RepID=X1I567_9ZZZZ